MTNSTPLDYLPLVAAGTTSSAQAQSSCLREQIPRRRRRDLDGATPHGGLETLHPVVRCQQLRAHAGQPGPGRGLPVRPRQGLRPLHSAPEGRGHGTLTGTPTTVPRSRAATSAPPGRSAFDEQLGAPSAFGNSAPSLPTWTFVHEG
jgi:hypothetical protein